MKSLLRLVLFAGVLASLDGINGMIPEAKNAQPPQTADVNDDWTQEEKDWGVDKVFYYSEQVYGKTTFWAPEIKSIFVSLYYDAGMSKNFTKSVLDKKTGKFNKFAVFLVVKGVFNLGIANEKELLVLDDKIDQKKLRNLFATFIDLKNDYEYLIKNSDLTQSKSPFIQWLLQDQEAVQFLRNILSKDSELPWSESSWRNFCTLRSQYLLGWPAPNKQPSK